MIPLLNEITAEELARRWRMSVGTLAVWRCTGKGPAYSRRGRNIAYAIDDIINYEEKTKIYPEDK